MRAVVVGLVVLGLAYVAIDVLADATQTRPDFEHPASRSEVIFRVGTRQHGRRPRLAAEGLWLHCQGATTGRRLIGDELEQVGDDTFRAVIQPALGTHAERRLRGCLEDVTVDRVKGRVVVIREIESPTER